MKQKMVPVFCVFVVCVVITHGQTNFYQEVSALWLSGQKSNVLDFAKQRLAQNTNDIAGLILKLEYEFAFLDTSNMTNTYAQALAVGAGIMTTNFQGELPIFQAGYDIMKEVLLEYTPEEIESDRLKASITNKPMTFGDLIKALQKDGYFTALLLAAQVTLKPEALAVSPGVLTAHVRLPEGYPVSIITSATCDGATPERMMLNDDGTEMIMKFRRQDIEAALARIGQSIDTNFVVSGVWQGKAGSNIFQGAASIMKIVGAKSK